MNEQKKLDFTSRIAVQNAPVRTLRSLLKTHGNVALMQDGKTYIVEDVNDWPMEAVRIPQRAFRSAYQLSNFLTTMVVSGKPGVIVAGNGGTPQLLLTPVEDEQANPELLDAFTSAFVRVVKAAFSQSEQHVTVFDVSAEGDLSYVYETKTAEVKNGTLNVQLDYHNRVLQTIETIDVEWRLNCELYWRESTDAPFGIRSMVVGDWRYSGTPKNEFRTDLISQGETVSAMLALLSFILRRHGIPVPAEFELEGLERKAAYAALAA